MWTSADTLARAASQRRTKIGPCFECGAQAFAHVEHIGDVPKPEWFKCTAHRTSSEYDADMRRASSAG